MHIGLHIGKFDWPGSPATIGPQLAEIAHTADAAGLYSLWVMDHLFQLGIQYGTVHGPITAPMLEGYSTIAYLAGITRRIRLGLLVTCPIYRHPGVLLVDCYLLCRLWYRLPICANTASWPDPRPFQASSVEGTRSARRYPGRGALGGGGCCNSMNIPDPTEPVRAGAIIPH